LTGHDDRILSGPRGGGEDAVVLRFPPGQALVQTVDFLTPVVDDPFRFGQIAAANEGSWGDEAAHVDDADAATAYVLERWRPGDVVLVKASRSIHLERVAEALRAAGSGKD